MIFYDFSGGMESSAMLAIERERIRKTGAIVRWADTGKQFPEMYQSIAQIESILDLTITVVPRRITFDEFLFERSGMIKKGTTDCSRRMKRGNLARHMKTFSKPWEINLGFNSAEQDRADKFQDRNERPWLHWRFPLLERGISREMTKDICRKAGFTIVLDMYEKMGRFDCFWCGNQTPTQALKVVQHYPELAKEWMDAEERKGHSFMKTSLKVLQAEQNRPGMTCDPATKCGCFGGDDYLPEGDEDDQD